MQNLEKYVTYSIFTYKINKTNLLNYNFSPTEMLTDLVRNLPKIKGK